MRESRRSHSTVSYGSTPGRVKRRTMPIPSCCGAIAMSSFSLRVRYPNPGRPPIEPLHLVVTVHLNREMEVHYSTVIPRMSTVSGRLRTVRPQGGNYRNPRLRMRWSALFRLRRLLQLADLALEVGEVLEPLVDRREPEVGDVIEGPQPFQHGHPDPV